MQHVCSHIQNLHNHTWLQLYLGGDLGDYGMLAKDACSAACGSAAVSPAAQLHSAAQRCTAQCSTRRATACTPYSHGFWSNAGGPPCCCMLAHYLPAGCQLLEAGTPAAEMHVVVARRSMLCNIPAAFSLPQAGKGDLGCQALYGAPRTQPLNDYRLIYFVKKCLDAYIVSVACWWELALPLPQPPPLPVLLGKWSRHAKLVCC